MQFTATFVSDESFLYWNMRPLKYTPFASCLLLPTAWSSSRSAEGWTSKLSKRKRGKGKQITGQSPPLLQLCRGTWSSPSVCRAEPFPSVLATDNWSTGLCTRLVPQVNILSHPSVQPAKLPSGRYWVLHAARSSSRKKESNSLMHSEQEFGPLDPETSSLPARIQAKALCPDSFGVNQAYIFIYRFWVFFIIIFILRESYFPGSKCPAAVGHLGPMLLTKTQQAGCSQSHGRDIDMTQHLLLWHQYSRHCKNSLLLHLYK